MSDLNLKLRHAKRQNAQNLDLSNSCIENVPVDLYQLRSLLNLNLSNNKISEIDKSIENLKNLTELNLENNNITILPNEILHLPNLSKLNLNNNPISLKLKDFNLNWKLSLKEFFEFKTANENKKEKNNHSYNENTNINNAQNDFINKNKFESTSLINKDRIQSAHSKNVPFSFNMSNIDGNSLSNKLTASLRSSQSLNANKNSNLTNPSLKKDNSVIDQIPNCLLFDGSYINNNFKIKENIELNTSAPIRLHTAGVMKSVRIIDRKDTTSNSKLNTNEIYSNEDKKNEKITQNKSDLTEIETNNKINEEILDSLKIKITKYEEEIKNMKDNFSEKSEEYKFRIKQLEIELKSLKAKSDYNDKKVENTINNKRNWMDHDVAAIPNHNTNSSIILNTEDKDNKIKELENQLQKEIQTTKRLKNEIERLNKQLTEKKASYSSDELIKNVREINYDEIQIENKIGQGGFSMIYKANWKTLPIALKVIFDPNVTEDLLNEFNNEIKMLFLLRHPNIILLLGISTKPQKLAIITEYVDNGSLFDVLHRSNKEINYPTKLKIILQLIRTFSFIHQNGIVHRDIKSHNVLVDENFNVKICDFGLAKPISELNWGNGQFSGTPAYMAPELFMKRGYDEKIDIFAFGTMLWEVLVRKIPFEGFEVVEIKNRTLSEEKLYLPKTIPTEWGNVINSCRSLDPYKRPSFVDLGNLKYHNYK